MPVLEQVKVNGVQYRRQSRKCGKPGCKCNIPGQEHGPYWYSYTDHGPAVYVGAKLPDQVLKHIDLLKTSRPQLKKIKAQIEARIEKAQHDLEKAQRELRTVESLEAGDYTASAVLKDLGLFQFNGQE